MTLDFADRLDAPTTQSEPATVRPARKVADPIDRAALPVEPWGLTETRHEHALMGARETVFAVANGHLGIRATPEEGTPAHAHGCFLNGFHETWEIKYPENAYGFAREGQTIVNLPDATTMALSVDGERLDLDASHVSGYQRSLDFRDGVLRRTLVWTTRGGATLQVTTTRLVSFTRRNLAVMTLEVTALSGNVEVQIASELRNRQDEPRVVGAGGFDPRRATAFGDRVLTPETIVHEGDRVLHAYRTTRSRLGLAVAVDHDVQAPRQVARTLVQSDDLATVTFTGKLVAGESLQLTKWAAYHDGPEAVSSDVLLDEARQTLTLAQEAGRDTIADEQRDWLTRYWRTADIEVGGQPEVQQAVRWCLFQLAQASARVERRGIGAKGVSGAGYEGHYFWDTEVYLVPFLIHTHPALAKGVLGFRLNTLDQARDRASELSQRGALFPWRTINGHEASAYFPAGTAQYHIDADVTFALAKYADVSGDPDYLTGEALPVLIETAKLYADLGFFGGPGNRFNLHEVTGPDEYTALVNNNLYTNLMARANLRRSAAALRSVRESEPERYARLLTEFDLAADAAETWEDAAEAMAVPYDKIFGVHGQDEDFLSREVWDLENTPASKQPLLLHYHPLVIYRHQVLKQADTVLALFLVGDAFSDAEKRANFEYYDPITTGDSTLSAAVSAIVAAEVGYQDRALSAFEDAVFVDLADSHHNTRDGVHVASAGGVWNALVHGFGGLRDFAGNLSLDPRLPASWEKLAFSCRLQGSVVRIELTADEVSLRLVEGAGGSICVRGHDVRLSERVNAVRIPLEGQGPVLPTITGRVPLIHGRPATPHQVTLNLPGA
ncbi:MAG: glycoside hydrolase family 65 protein [Micropruina sp.]|nr:glycoside hydrolase family 65 protein [Micropruina sp.]